MFVLFVSQGIGKDWPQLRGPQANGIASTTATPPLNWSDTENIQWKTAIPGRGHSSPVVSKNNIYLTTALEEEVSKKKYGNNMSFFARRITLVALCIDLKTGKLQWQTEIDVIEKPDPVHTMNTFATPTPVLGDDRLFCDFGTYGTACLSTENGEVRWKKRLPLDHEVGPGSSIMLYKNRLILLRDGRNQQYLTALNTDNGKEVWKTARPPMSGNNGDYHKSFSSPIVFSAAGRTQLVAPGAQWIASYNPTNGKELWRVKHGRGFSLAAQPSEANGMIYFCTGFSGNQVMAIRHNGSGDVTKSHVAWQTRRLAPTIPSPVVLKERIYWIKDSGEFCCVNALTGDPIWKKKLAGKFLSSPVLAANRIYLTNQTGETTVLKTGDAYTPVATNKLSARDIFATPAFVDNAIILRTGKHLYHIAK